MTFNDNLAAHYANVEQSNIMNSFIKYYIDSELVALKNLVLDAPPETLDTLNELAAAIGDDPAFFSSMSAANTTLQSNIDTLQAAAQAARDLIQADVDANETAAASALSTETSNREAAVAALQALVDAAQTARTAMQADIDQNEADADAADAALSGRLDVLEADSTTATAVAAVQSDVDQNEVDSDAADAALSGRLDVLEADPTTATAVAAGDAATLVSANTYTDTSITNLVNGADGALDTLKEIGDALAQGDSDVTTALTTQITTEATTRGNADTALSGRLDVLEADPTTAAAVAAVQADVDQNETDSDAAEAALSARLDTLEADPTTATAVAAVQADVDQNEADADAALALKAPLADPDFTGVLEVDTNARLEFGDNLTKLHNVLRGTYINIGNNIELRPAAAGGRVEITGDVIIDASDFVDATNDTNAAAGGVVVGQVYRNGSDLKVRVS